VVIGKRLGHSAAIALRESSARPDFYQGFRVLCGLLDAVSHESPSVQASIATLLQASIATLLQAS
jgi:hypothetical protein